MPSSRVSALNGSADFPTGPAYALSPPNPTGGTARDDPQPERNQAFGSVVTKVVFQQERPREGRSQPDPYVPKSAKPARPGLLKSVEFRRFASSQMKGLEVVLAGDRKLLIGFPGGL
jgi:hypothetical protein